MAKVEKTAVEDAEKALAAARKIEDRMDRIRAVQSAAEALNLAKVGK